MFDYYIEQFINDFSLSDNAGFYCVPSSDGVMATYQEKDIGGRLCPSGSAATAEILWRSARFKTWKITDISPRTNFMCCKLLR